MFAVLRHRDFRLLWIAQVVSQLGDWLNRVGGLVLIGQIVGTEGVLAMGTLYGLEHALRMLPMSLIGPLAGPVADRLPRRAVMIGADLIRVGIVLCLLFVRDGEHITLLFVLLFLQMGVGMFFDAARAGVLPNTVPKEDLHAAYALAAVTWSATLSLGAALSGVLVGLVGVSGAFLVDAATYALSAGTLLFLRVPKNAAPTRTSSNLVRLVKNDLALAIAHLRSRRLGAFVFAKTFWGPAGGFIVILSLLARTRFESAAGLATITGVLFAARGLGTAIGPAIARRISGSSQSALLGHVRMAFLIGPAGYTLVAFARDPWVAALGILISHAGGSALWVASTTLWQQGVDDAFRGRIHSLEFLTMALSGAIAAVVAGIAFDRGLALTPTILCVAFALLVSGEIWRRLLSKGALRDLSNPRNLEPEGAL